MTNEERFWIKLARMDNGCWEPTNKPTSKGYVQVRTAWRRGQLAHRVAVELATGQPIPEDLEVDHLCKNRRCCNPSHLEVVTRTENNRRTDGTVLTLQAAEEIRTLYAAGDYTQDELARRYGISCGHVGHIIRGLYWRAS